MTEYKLINPHIEGKFKKLYQGKTSFDAAQSLWENLSANFTNCMPEFAFTVERVKDNKMFHYKVNESVKNNNVNYTITELDINLSAAKKKKFNKKLNNFKNKVQSGGKKKKKRKVSVLDEDDEDDEEDDTTTEEELFDVFMFNDQFLYDTPISYFWYYPDFYPYAYDYYFVPTWIPSLSPYVIISSYM